MKKKTPTPRTPIICTAMKDGEPVGGVKETLHPMMRYYKHDSEEAQQVEVSESLKFVH